MYCEGVCPDFSYSFCSKPPPTASLIIKYIEKNMITVNTGNTVNSENMEISRNENKENKENKESRENKESNEKRVSGTDVNENVRRDAVHALRTAMNCKIENKDKEKDKENQSIKSTGLSTADYVKQCQKSLVTLQNKVAVSKTPCKYVHGVMAVLTDGCCVMCVVCCVCVVCVWCGGTDWISFGVLYNVMICHTVKCCAILYYFMLYHTMSTHIVLSNHTVYHTNLSHTLFLYT